MPRLILTLFLAVLAIATAIALLVLLFKLCQLLFRIVGGTARFLAWCLAELWRTAFPKPYPKPSPEPRKFPELSRRRDRLVSTVDTKSPPPALPTPELLPKPALPRPSKPGEHFLWVQDILVSVREEDGRFIFETTPASRWNEAISWLQDEGLFDKIVNKTFRWGDHQPPTK